jgi:AraC-like DNA-binding protein
MADEVGDALTDQANGLTGPTGRRVVDPMKRHMARPVSMISLRYARTLLDAAQSHGLSAVGLCAAAGIDVPREAAPDARLPAENYLRLWMAIMEKLDDPAFPLRVAEVTDTASLDVLGFAVTTSSTFGDALDRVQRYLPIMTSASGWELTHSGSDARLALVREAVWRPEHRLVDEFALANMVVLSRALTRTRWIPTEVRFRHAEPADVTAQHALFGAPLRFDCRRSELRFPSDLLALPLVKADSAMARFFDRYIEGILQRTYPARSIVHSLKPAILQGLSSGDHSLERAAKSLSVSGRTLRRRLLEEGVVFRRVLDEVRCDLAKRHLEERRLTLGEIAFVLGYSDAAPFHRAFRRWTHMTPEEYRATISAC